MLEHEELRRLCGDVPEWKLAALAEVGARKEDIEAALAWVHGQSDVMGEVRRPATGPVARVSDILIADEESWEANEEGPSL